MTALRPRIASVTALLHSGSGIDAKKLGKGPASYVSQLARYIRDPSTIRARCMNEWGRAPSINEIRVLMANEERKRSTYRREWEKLGEDEADENDFCVRPTPFAVSEQLAAVHRAANTLPFDAQAIIAAPSSNDGMAFLNSATIIAKVARIMKVTPDDIAGPSRKARIVSARKVVTYILRQRGWSFPKIATRLNRSDHTSAVHYFKSFEAKADERMRWIAAQFMPAEAVDESEAA